MASFSESEALVVTTRAQERLGDRIAMAGDNANLRRLASEVYTGMGPVDTPLPELARVLDRNPNALDSPEVADVLRRLDQDPPISKAWLGSWLHVIVSAARSSGRD